MSKVHKARLGSGAQGTADLGGWTADFGSCPAGFPPAGAEIFRGLPDGHCQAVHIGYLFKGSFRIRFPDGRVDTIEAGEAYYIEAGHTFESIDDIEYVEFTPTADFLTTSEVMQKNLAEFQAKQSTPGK